MSIQKLLSIAGPATSLIIPDKKSFFDQYSCKLCEDLFRLLSVKNGFYSFEAALHVFSWGNQKSLEKSSELQAWNHNFLWRDAYEKVTDGLIFFAEDIFGGQFAIKGDEIVFFDPESAEVENIAKSIDDWANKILLNYSCLTGYPLAHDWQKLNGPLAPGKRLLPKRPFILGGDYSVDNLFAADAVRAMRYRGDIWRQLRYLPDGAKVRLNTSLLN